jgi:hypothetical protein
MMRRLGRSLMAGLLGLSIFAAAAPASAGGSWFDTVQPSYEPGVGMSFDLPTDLERGVYGFNYCNHDCTGQIGDLIGGTIYIGVETEGRSLDSPEPADPGNQIPKRSRVAMVAIAGGAIGLVALTARRHPH